MTIVQKYPELSGAQKKQKIIDDSDLLPEDQEDAANAFVQLTLPPMIDAVVDAYKHNIDPKKIRAGCLACFSKCRR